MGQEVQDLVFAGLLKALGANNIVLVDKNGVLCKGETWMNDAQKEFAEVTNFEGVRGTS